MLSPSIAIQYEEGAVDKLTDAVLAYVVRRDMGYLSIPVPALASQITRLQGTSNVIRVRDLSGSSESEKRLALLLSATDSEAESDDIKKALKRAKIRRITQEKSLCSSDGVDWNSNTDKKSPFCSRSGNGKLLARPVSPSTPLPRKSALPKNFYRLKPAAFDEIDITATCHGSDPTISPRGVKRTMEEDDSPQTVGKRIQSRNQDVCMSEEDLSIHWHRKIKEIEIREAHAQTARNALELKITSERADAAASTKKYQRVCNDAKELLYAVLAKAKTSEEGRLLLEARLRGRIADLENMLSQECTARMEAEKKWELLSAETAYMSHDRIFELEAKLKEESELRQKAEFELEKSNSLLVDRGRAAEAFHQAVRSRDAGVMKTLSMPIGPGASHCQSFQQDGRIQDGV